MANFDVTTQSLGEVAQLLRSAISVFDERVANSDGVVRQVAGGTWQGEDAELFADSWAKWHAGAMGVRMALDNIAMTLLAAQMGYEGVENALDSGFDEVTASIAGAASSANAGG